MQAILPQIKEARKALESRNKARDQQLLWDEKKIVFEDKSIYPDPTKGKIEEADMAMKNASWGKAIEAYAKAQKNFILALDNSNATLDLLDQLDANKNIWQEMVTKGATTPDGLANVEMQTAEAAELITQNMWTEAGVILVAAI